MLTVMEQIIKDAFYNPQTGFGSSQKLYQKLKRKHPTITLNQIRIFIKSQETNQIHTKQKKSIDTQNQTISYGFGELQIDLFDLSIYQAQNKKYRYILMVVDIYSRK